MRSPYLLSLIDQAFLSALTFALSFLLIRIWDPGMYGVFALWQAIAMFTLGIQNALVVVLLNVYVPAAQSEEEKATTERVLSTTNLIVVVGAFLFAGLLALSGVSTGDGELTISLTIATFIAAGLMREFTRNVAFARRRVDQAVRMDFNYLLIASTIFVIYAFESARINLEVVFAILAAASIISTFSGFLIVRSRSMLPYRRFSFTQYRPFWSEARWALLGTVSVDVLSRGYVYLVTALAGPVALGLLAAGRVLFGPIPLILRSWARVARPHLAEAAAQGKPREMLKTLLWAFCIVVSALVGLLCLLYIFWMPIENIIYGGRYEGIGFIVAGWAVVSAVTCFRPILTVALHALKKFKPLAEVAIYGGITSTILVALIIPLYGYELVFLGVLGGELVALIYVTNVFRKEIKKLFEKT